MDKRALRKFAVPSRKPNVRSGVFCAEQIEYVVCTIVRNIAGHRTLVLYVYSKEQVVTGDFTPRWTTFQTSHDHITLRSDEKGTHWQTCMFENLSREYGFIKKCAFYSVADEERVCRFLKRPGLKGFDCLYNVQLSTYCRKRQENEIKSQRKIIERMKSVGHLPRDIKGFMHRETLPHYIFYDYKKGKAPMDGYCTACRHEVSVTGAKHNSKGVCPRCKKEVMYKSRGRRGYIIDRSTAQVIQRIDENELIIRFVKAYCRYPKSDKPEFSVYENARLFLRWENDKIVKRESFYYSYNVGCMTAWHRGDRPVFSKWQYNFEADCCGYLYHRNLTSELKGTPWQYSALKEYYFEDPTPLYAASYLREYLRYPMLEYLVKLRLFRLATYVVYGDSDGRQYYGNDVLNSDGKTVTEVLGVDKKYIPIIQQINPDSKQLRLIKAFLREKIEINMDFMKWYSECETRVEEQIMVPLRFMTPHKLMHYATEQFAVFQKTSYASPGYASVSHVLSDYKDYLSMSEALGHDMSSSFVLFPNNLKEAHDRVNDLTEAETSKAYDRKIAMAFAGLQNRYQFEKFGLMVLPPHSAKEIAQEGDALHHCVGRYIQSVVKDECIILFIRESSAPEKPYCTVEIREGDIVQARMQNNGSPTPDVQKFIELWERQVLYAPVSVAA